MDEKDKIEYGNDELENLWTAVCCNDLNYMKQYYANNGESNRRYNKFNNNNSLIMGALRNKNFDMVELLKEYGETILKDELAEYKQIMATHKYKDEITKNSRDN